jgi:hypothetical protein
LASTCSRISEIRLASVGEVDAQKKAKIASVLILGRGTIDFRFREFAFVSGGELGARRRGYAASVNRPSTR